ncbi:hypothetical protein D9M68_743780 [compost metagenome]
MGLQPEVIFEGVEDAEALLAQAQGEPGDGVGLLRHQRQAGAEEILHFGDFARLGFQAYQQGDFDHDPISSVTRQRSLGPWRKGPGPPVRTGISTGVAFSCGGEFIR